MQLQYVDTTNQYLLRSTANNHFRSLAIEERKGKVTDPVTVALLTVIAILTFAYVSITPSFLGFGILLFLFLPLMSGFMRKRVTGQAVLTVLLLVTTLLFSVSPYVTYFVKPDPDNGFALLTSPETEGKTQQGKEEETVKTETVATIQNRKDEVVEKVADLLDLHNDGEKEKEGLFISLSLKDISQREVVKAPITESYSGRNSPKFSLTLASTKSGNVFQRVVAKLTHDVVASQDEGTMVKLLNAEGQE